MGKRDKDAASKATTARDDSYPQTTPSSVSGGNDLPVSSLARWARKGDLLITAMLLAALGLSVGILYWGHLTVPNSDFTSFIQTGHELLSFKTPSSFKRLPLVGLLQAILSRVVPGSHPDLTAGWLLNLLMYPGIVVMFWWVGRRVLGRAAVWVAILLAVNPYFIRMMVDPIAETAFFFFALLAFTLLALRSRWAYVAAAAVMLIRYEGAGVLLAVFVWDVLDRKGLKPWAWAIGRSVLAVLPVLFWILWGQVASKSTGAASVTSYAGHYSGDIVVPEFLANLWTIAFRPLVSWQLESGQQPLELLSQFSAVVGVALALFWSIWRRHHFLLALFAFVFFFAGVHGLKADTLDRYAIPLAWPVLLLAISGFVMTWQAVSGRFRIPARAMLAVIVLLILAAVWLCVCLAGRLDQAAAMSPPSRPVPWIVMVAVILLLALSMAQQRWQQLPGCLLIACLVFAGTLANQQRVARILGIGGRDVEFKRLALWYRDYPGRGEKLVTTMPSILELYNPEDSRFFVHKSNIDEDSPREFIRACYERDIRLVAWDSRLGLARNNSYYNMWHLKSIDSLMIPRDQGPYEFITRIDGAYRHRFIHVFRLKPLEELLEDYRSHREPQGEPSGQRRSDESVIPPADMRGRTIRLVLLLTRNNRSYDCARR